jgi:peptide/nickel transport system permease protein
MGVSQSVSTPLVSTPTRTRLWVSALRYLAGKAVTILLTIFVGVFITMLIVNYPGGRGGEPGVSPFELRLESQIDSAVRSAMYQGTIIIPSGRDYDQQVEFLKAKMREDVGLNLPFLPRNLLWTIKSLSFNWGELSASNIQPLGIGQIRKSSIPDNPVLQYFPNTLLLVGTAYLLAFLLGMPLALYLARNHGSRLDRLVTILSPISSVPSWVFAILLIVIFGVQLHWLPVAGMFDFRKPDEPVAYTLTLLKHMLLPVSALLLSLLFQLVYTWRTFFIIYSEEDYVELARAKGLENKVLERLYILKPALPYIITSFTTSLIGFWQLTVALEKTFQWPGIGLLYIEALPNYWHERVEIGDLMIVIQIVVIFAYLLGILVFILDLVYVMVDPRIHLVPKSNISQVRTKTVEPRVVARMKGKSPGRARQLTGSREKWAFSLAGFLSNVHRSMRDLQSRSWLFFQELRAYPSAIFGLIVIIILMAGSLYAIIALPYEEFGRAYDAGRATGRNSAPRVAAPIWFNYFSSPPRLSALSIDENSREAAVTTRALDNGWVEKTVTFTFDYVYKEIPSDVFLYFDPEYNEKFPFVSFLWKTPDGRTLDLKAKAIGADSAYDFNTSFLISRELNSNPAWKNWFVSDGQNPTPAFTLLFAKTDAAEPTPQRGTYQLEIKSLLFENGDDLKSELVLLGQVYGMAGTDYWRRDLIVPLFWGMPFALFIGFLGTFITTLIAMLLPAVGVWFGGGLDNFIQRLTEVNMVLPGLAIAVLANLLFGTNIWIVLGIVVLLNAFGSPIKSFRSAFLQAKEAPYIEMARSYGASDFRIIMHYLVPRILPVFIPQLVTQIPSFIFLEATLGFFKINSNYPSWGRIIYEGLSRGALYGSPFWVLEPIFLLLLTGLAFAMLGAALERILNPRVISDIPVATRKAAIRQKKDGPAILNRRVFAGVIAVLLLVVIFIPTMQGKTLARYIFNFIDETRNANSRIIGPSAIPTNTALPAASAPTIVAAPATEPLFTLTPTRTVFPAFTTTETQTSVEATLTPLPTASQLATYTLQRDEFPYCIARRFNVDPTELLALNGLLKNQTFYTGTVLQIPQTGNPFPYERMLKSHPAIYTVVTSGETLYTIACGFGDVEPLSIAQANDISMDSNLFVGQQLNIP